MIQMICGYTGVGTKLVGPKDGPFELPAEAEKHLVERGVAEYVEAALASPTAPAGENAEAAPGVNTPEQFDAPAAEKTAQDGLALDDCIDVVDGHMTVESLMTMTRANMEALAADLGIDAKKCKNKAEIAALLSQVEVDEAGTIADADGPSLAAAMPS